MVVTEFSPAVSTCFRIFQAVSCLLTDSLESVVGELCLAAQASAPATRTSSRSLSSISRLGKLRTARPLSGGRKIPPPSRLAGLVGNKGERHEQTNYRPSGDGRLPNELPWSVGNMTAEIAILNRRAAALSADSAVTITQTGKIYNSADKIFELSTRDPIGLMVYNSLDYMGIPLDVIIKSFRESPRCERHFRNVFDAASAFFDFLRNDFQISEEAENFHVEDLLFEHVRSLAGLVLEAAARRLAEGIHPVPGRESRAVTLPFDEMFNAAIDAEIAKLRSFAINECLYDVDLKNLMDRYGHTIDGLFDDAGPFISIVSEGKDKFREYCCLALQKNRFSENHTGLVFAGYGDKQLFPSLISYRFDGMILSRLKMQERDKVEIDNNNERARIIPFAQREMVDRFLYGIDLAHEGAILRSLGQAMTSVIDGAVPLMRGLKRQRQTTLRNYLDKAGLTMIRGLRERTIRQLKDGSELDSLDAVSVMSKPDLANFAEALVNITSVKKRDVPLLRQKRSAAR
jgi:hypothetical protein